jgi:hypothetical protein
MTHPGLTWHPSLSPQSSIARLGNYTMGSVFPSSRRHVERWHHTAWAWHASLGKPTGIRFAPSEQAAKDALTARVAEWLRDAGLEQVKETGE